MYTSGSNFLFHLLSLRYRTYMNDRTMVAVKQKLTNVNAEIPVVEGKNEEYVCFLACATITNSAMEASEGSSWARDWHGFVQKLKSGTATLSEFEQLDKLELLNHGRKYKKKAQDHVHTKRKRKILFWKKVIQLFWEYCSHFPNSD